MTAAAATRTRRTWRTRWVLFYQDASGTPDDEVREGSFLSEDDARAWADAHYVVPLWLEEREQLLGDGGRVLGTIAERFEI